MLHCNLLVSGSHSTSWVVSPFLGGFAPHLQEQSKAISEDVILGVRLTGGKLDRPGASPTNFY